MASENGRSKTEWRPLDAVNCKNDIELLTKRNIKSIIESESDRLEECDFMIDFCFEDNEWDIDTIYYLKDNAGQYYITEV